MDKAFYKYVWAKFYKDYLLPTNPSSKNPFFRELLDRSDGYSIKTDNGLILDEWKLRKRIQSAYRNWWIHAVCWVLQGGIWLVSLNDGMIRVAVIVLVTNILINIYPILVQKEIHDRCIKILEGRSKKKNTPK